MIAVMRAALVLMMLTLSGLVPSVVRADGPDEARFIAAQSVIEVAPKGWFRRGPQAVTITLTSSRAVPYRSYFLADPPRLIVDFKGLDFAGQEPAQVAGHDAVAGLRWGRFRDGWSRMVIELASPYALRQSVQAGAEGGSSSIRLSLEPVDEADFITRPDPMAALWDLPESVVPPIPARPRKGGEGRPLRIALDPGHGGKDPGAQVGAITEASLMLGFARELEIVLKDAGYEVIATRREDVFVPLEQRMTIARAGGADLFLSLHADALPAGQAAGATVYTWNSAANDRASVELATRHDRDDLLAGVDLSGTDDEIADLLMDLARTENGPKAKAFAGMLASEMAKGGLDTQRRPVRGAAFSVLKSPDIPSVLIELGFLTDPNDRANLFDPDWRNRMAQAIARAIADWAETQGIRANSPAN